jgi:predicted metalloprotease with PDZ domain
VKKTKTPTPHNAGLVAGALNVMGGLLTRRKAVNLNDTDGSSDSNTIISPSHLIDPDVKDTLKAGAFTISDSAEDNEPYHRVVSAPPGRIGITFVQYRGHAMVSDVHQDSPLVGWIFPSDIVIAIDEIPVSGTRVPEIVKLLTIRKDRQRALRVISSHAMTDLIVTEKSGAFIDG